MFRSRVALAALGLVALLATAAGLALEIVLANGLRTSAFQARIAAIVASAVELLAMGTIIVLLANCFRKPSEHRSARPSRSCFVFALLVITLASIASIVFLALMGKNADLPKPMFRVPSNNFLIGAAVALGFAFGGQLIFTVAYFVRTPVPCSQQGHSARSNEDRRSPLPMNRVKSVPYSRTKAATHHAKRVDGSSYEYPTPPPSSSGRSATETMSSFRSSFSHTVHPMGSRTRLLSNSSRSSRARHRAASLDSDFDRERTSETDDGFDSWDTSTVDPRNRQMVIETSASPVQSRFLETIPASPATSRAPSPGFPFDLQPPRPCHRSRSYSPSSRSDLYERSITPQSSTEELHIHPLFRSDSPVPPPSATPGTIVVASPNAGQVIPSQSVRRMRSDSLPTSPSPLSREGTQKSSHKASSVRSESLRPEEVAEEMERKMTPPIPEWILSAGARSSLTDYNSRKLREQGLTPDVASQQ
ncbi:hypothetical protein F4780DRAFT_796471 [Xylariomycetidae sp. FL0641]|nr:hypothetical protein F4780DRAFT_789086 [Xylariomycetidae sp. FL0641]KAI0017320.1 hypothetical protein F4780DRAFT_796471 [Xylariomycetidae sp. FL0641]